MKHENCVVVTTDRAGFEYDIHSLVKAFYPACDVKVLIRNEENKEVEGSAFGLPDLDIKFCEDAILLSLICGENEKASFCVKKIETPGNMPRPEVKNHLKQLVYAALSEYTGKTLPWGTLTGIRPTKIPMNMLEEGKTAADIMQYMQETYLISREKGNLAIQIAEREKALLENLHCGNGYSLYIGIPFCSTTCLYCSFTSYPIVSWKKRVTEYLNALEKEIAFAAEMYKDKVLDAVYIGGGTPTTLETEELLRLLEKINDSFDLSGLKEFTVEAGRADSITPDKLRALREGNVTRISVNPQTMKQETLDIIGRRHTTVQVKEAYRMAREAGFTNINMDLILGLPKEGAEDVRRTMEEIKELNPDSLTVHSLAVKRASALNRWIEENGIQALNNTDEMMQITADGAAGMGMVPYYLYRQKNMSGNFENVGYAREGKFGIYNILMMEEKQDIIALGAGSISKRIFPDGRIERCENVKDVALYLEKIDEMIERKRKLFETDSLRQAKRAGECEV